MSKMYNSVVVNQFVNDFKNFCSQSVKHSALTLCWGLMPSPDWMLFWATNLIYSFCDEKIHHQNSTKEILVMWFVCWLCLVFPPRGAGGLICSHACPLGNSIYSTYWFFGMLYTNKKKKEDWHVEESRWEANGVHEMSECAIKKKVILCTKTACMLLLWVVLKVVMIFVILF